MTPDFEAFFRDYAELYNRALTDSPDYEGIMNCFAPCFVGAGPGGVQCGENGADFRAQLEQGFAFYKQVGTKRMRVRRCDVHDIDAGHHLVKVHYGADYETTSGQPVTIDFDVTYLLASSQDAPRIFAFIAGDEMEAYRRAGLLD